MSKQIHAFNVDMASKLGLEESIILHQFLFWVERSEANDKNFHDGRYWTYNSVTALQKLFPYMSDSTIKRKIQNLRDKGIILVGKFHDDKAQRSNWYAVDQVKLTQSLGQIDIVSGSDCTSDVGQNDQMYINSSNNISNHKSESDSLNTKKEQQQSSESNFDTLYASYPRKTGRKAAFKHFQATVKTQKDLEDIANALTNYNAYLTHNAVEFKYTQMASTWFNNWRDWANDFWSSKTVKAKATGASGREL